MEMEKTYKLLHFANGQPDTYVVDEAVFAAVQAGKLPVATMPEPPKTQPIIGTPVKEPVADPVESLELLEPLFDCKTGDLTFQTQFGDGTPIEFMSPGVKSWSKLPTGRLDANLLTGKDSGPLTLYARQSGKQITRTFDFRAYCAAQKVETPTKVDGKPAKAAVAFGPAYVSKPQES